MKADPVVISYFTRNTFYEKDAEHLRRSCERMGLEYSIEGIESFGKWHNHVCFKPIYILKKMKELKRPLLWIDADAEVVQKPNFSLFDCDIGVHLFEGLPTDHPCYLFAGTIYLDYNARTVSVVNLWAEECKAALHKAPNLEVSDQDILFSILKRKNIRFSTLPSGYAAIFDSVAENLPREDLFIVHYQASRLYKKFINGDVAAFEMLNELSIEQLRTLTPRIL